jgi:hypothetical protein
LTANLKLSPERRLQRLVQAVEKDISEDRRRPRGR